MDDATQKLVDEEAVAAYPDNGTGVVRNAITLGERHAFKRGYFAALEAARAEVDAYERDAVERSEQGRTDYDYEQKIAALEAALEAAQRPPVSQGTPRELTCDACGRDYPVWFAPDDVWNLGGPERPGFECPSCFAGKYETHVGEPIVWEFHPQRPPVSPEAREGMRDALREAHQYDYDFDPEWDYTDDDDRYIDALLARFSVPSQPVYDEDAIARWLFGLRYHSMHWLDAKEPERAEYRRDAAALVAALWGGELTREEDDRG